MQQGAKAVSSSCKTVLARFADASNICMCLGFGHLRATMPLCSALTASAICLIWDRDARLHIYELIWLPCRPNSCCTFLTLPADLPQSEGHNSQIVVANQSAVFVACFMHDMQHLGHDVASCEAMHTDELLSAVLWASCDCCSCCMQSKYILIATGGTPAVPPIEGKELCVISDAVLDTMQRPQKKVLNRNAHP